MICLLPHCAWLSETSRILEIYRVLVERGAPVRVATHGGTYEWVLREAGVPYDLVEPRITKQRSEAFVRTGVGVGPPDQSMWSDEEMRAHVGAEATYFREHGVRVAVTGFTLTTLLSTRVVGIPLVTEHAGSWVPPTFERRLLPARTARARIPFGRWLPEPLARRLINSRAERLTIHIAGFNRVANELGVVGIPSFSALVLGDLTLVTDVPEVLGVPRDELESWTPRTPSRYRPGTRLRYTGPIYGRLAAPVPEGVERFLVRPPQIVYVALTSTPPELVRDVVGALRPLDASILVAATVHDLRDLEEERVHVAGVLPSHEIMPRVDLAVTTGGQGSVHCALASGVPLLGLPLHGEQELNVTLAERQGAARLVPRRAAGTGLLTETAREMLADDRYRDNARGLQAILASVDGPGAAADAILELLGKRTGDAALKVRNGFNTKADPAPVSPRACSRSGRSLRRAEA